jgi:nucleotide-binding universal stress UspA family protein
MVSRPPADTPASAALGRVTRASLQRVVVGLDGSAASLDALRWAVALADTAGAEVTAAHAFMPPPAEGPFADYDVRRAEARRRLIDWSATLDSAGAIDTLVVDGHPDALLSTAAQGADLLVVGTRGAGGFAQLHLGSVAHHLAHRTPVPLAIVPTSAASERVARIVVGVDGSAGSAAAVAFCATLAPLVAASVVAVFAFEPFVAWVPETDPRSWHRGAEASVRDWVAPIEAAGVHVEVDVDRDIHPVAALCRAIQAEPDTLAVVGARGVGGFSGLRLGRVPVQLVHHAGAAVVMVPTWPHPRRLAEKVE